MGKLIINKLFTSSTTFKVTAAMHRVVLIAVGGGGNGAYKHSGGGGGCSVLFVDEPIPEFVYTLTVGGVGGNTSIAWTNILNGTSGPGITANGGANATDSAHGTGGSASGGDINSTGGTGNTTAGGGAGSPFGDSTAGGDMFMIEEYALAYEQMLKHNLLNNGYTWPQTPPNPWTGSYYNTDSGMWIPAFRGDDLGTLGTRRAGFLGKGNFSLTTISGNPSAYFHSAGFGSAEGITSTSEGVNGIAGGFGRHSTAQKSTRRAASGFKSAFGGGGGYNNNTGEGNYHNGVNGGYGGGGGGYAADDGTAGTGGSGAILALIETDDILCIPYL